MGQSGSSKAAEPYPYDPGLHDNAAATRNRGARLVEFLRFAMVGLLVTALSQLIYWSGVNSFGLDPIASIIVSYGAGMGVGYIAHGRYSFVGDFETNAHLRRLPRFIAVNFIGLALNTLFVIVLVRRLEGATWWPILPNVVVTPIVTFLLHRKWTYRAKTGSKPGPWQASDRTFERPQLGR